jgi:hypothetical protein
MAKRNSAGEDQARRKCCKSAGYAGYRAALDITELVAMRSELSGSERVEFEDASEASIGIKESWAPELASRCDDQASTEHRRHHEPLEAKCVDGANKVQ